MSRFGRGVDPARIGQVAEWPDLDRVDSAWYETPTVRRDWRAPGEPATTTTAGGEENKRYLLSRARGAVRDRERGAAWAPPRQSPPQSFPRLHDDAFGYPRPRQVQLVNIASWLEPPPLRRFK